MVDQNYETVTKVLHILGARLLVLYPDDWKPGAHPNSGGSCPGFIGLSLVPKLDRTRLQG